MHSLPAKCSQFLIPSRRLSKKAAKAAMYREENHTVLRKVGGKRREERGRREKRREKERKGAKEKKSRDEKRGGKGRGETQLDATSARESKLCVTGKHNGRESSNNAQRLSYNTPGATCGL